MHWIIDTDAGVDDAIGIGMAFALGAKHNSKVLAFTTVSGNVALNKVNTNVSTLIDVFNQSTPYYIGCDRPLTSKIETAEEFHGEDGLGGNGLVKTHRKAANGHAAQAIAQLAKQYEGDIGIIALAPLTNIALAFNLDPELPKRLSKLVIMGGAWQARGNLSSAAEFNFAADPESAHLVFERMKGSTQGMGDIVLVPWEPALTSMWAYDRIERLGKRNTPRSYFAWKMCEKIIDQLRENFGLPAYPMPDPMAVAIALDESVIAQEVRAFVRIDIGHNHGRALSTLDYRHPHPNTRVVTAVHAERFYKMMEDAWA